MQEQFHALCEFRACAKIRALREFFYLHEVACFSFCFAHNFLIQTPFWVILVSLESLESVEYKYVHKEHF